MRYTKEKVSQLCGITPSTIDYHIWAEVIPKPTIKGKGRSRYYTARQYAQIKNHFAKHETVKASQGLLSKNAMAKKLGLSSHERISYHIARGNLDGPTISNGRRMYYCNKDIGRLKTQLQSIVLSPANIRWDELANSGLYSQSKAAPLLAMPLVTLSKYIKDGKLPGPQRKVGVYMMYDKEDIKNMKKQLTLYYANRKARRVNQY